MHPQYFALLKEEAAMEKKEGYGFVAMRGMMIALAMIFSYIESFVPVPVPGIKIGLTNVVVLFALFRFGEKEAGAINIVRIVLVGFTFGNMFSIVYSLSGGMLSLIVMIFMKKSLKLDITAVSVAGGVSHNIGQIIVAMVVLNTSAISLYLPILWISGIVAGVIIGILGKEIINRIPEKITYKIYEK